MKEKTYKRIPVTPETVRKVKIAKELKNKPRMDDVIKEWADKEIARLGEDLAKELDKKREESEVNKFDLRF